jgi:Cu-processing system permease protein
MNTTAKLAHIQTRDMLRSRWSAVYAAFFFLLTEALLRFSGGDAKAILSLATVTLMVIPLATLMLATIYVYNAREFTELMLAQPIRRSSLYVGLFAGVAIPAVGGFVLGVAVPFVLRAGTGTAQWGALLTLLLVGTGLTLAFTAVAFCVALRTEDRLRGVGIALGIWLLLAVAYDGMVLTTVELFSDYPIERPLLAAMFANPVDLARVLLLLKLDASALMGYTGAVFERFFAGVRGFALASAMLIAWIGVPLAVGARLFRKKDF